MCIHSSEEERWMVEGTLKYIPLLEMYDPPMYIGAMMADGIDDAAVSSLKYRRDSRLE